ncbi:MAG: TetR/AcrR family transcriptional regulator [Treponema sp.]|nr:TetR/AcrR family transcriptional regulator [Treponema sp.]MCL2250828.1 TetR/AcrR family transcriptional regulator [Treponema sp.]
MEEYKWLNNILNDDTEKITDKQKLIIRAAIELFSKQGYAATSTREIAQKAGVAEGSVFKLFPTKKDLILWIIKHIIKTSLFPLISSGINELMEKPFNSREDFLNAFFENRLELIQEGAPLFKILIQEIPFQPEIRAMLLEQFKKLPLDIIAKKLITTEINSDFNEIDIINIIITCLTGFFFSRIIMFPEIFPENRIKNDAAVLVRFMSRGFKSEKEQNL